MSSTPLARILAQRTLALDATSLPPEVLEAAQLHLLDAIGVGLAGGAGSTSPIRADVSLLGSGDSTVIGRAAKLSAAHAALVNGTFMHSMEFDDTHVPSVIHGSAVVAPAVLAIGERQRSTGAEALLAFAAAWEVLILIGMASPGGFQAAGFQTVAAAGPFGSAVAAALLSGRSEDELVHALGMAGSQASGTFAFLSNASTVKAMHAGWAAHSGILAADLAALGVTGPEAVFEDTFGFFASYTQDSDAATKFAGLIPRLGEEWSLPEAAFKGYPCCHYIHPFLEAAENLRFDGVAAASIAEIICHVPEGAAPIICEPWERKLAPSSDHDARWSLPVCLAFVLLRGRLRPEDIAGIATNAEVLALAAKIRFEPWPDSGFPARFPARLVVATTSGRSHDVTVNDVRGSVSRPFDADAIRDKFLRNAAPIIGGECAAKIITKVQDLPDSPDVSSLTRLLGAAAGSAG